MASDNPNEADTQQDGALINHESLVMELDTRAAVSIISEKVVKEKFHPLCF